MEQGKEDTEKTTKFAHFHKVPPKNLPPYVFDAITRFSHFFPIEDGQFGQMVHECMHAGSQTIVRIMQALPPRERTKHLQKRDQMEAILRALDKDCMELHRLHTTSKKASIEIEMAIQEVEAHQRQVGAYNRELLAKIEKFLSK
eukprot:TRINITY_DN6340_c0_g1_i1.p1 TRINITY_DN6340_c0_g1~~TRINITY_DN6340_c0_g1_i1.p1  ORF type:complete len:144 (-),score=21.24 TRINITY_DN6340_c0_g1_i1:27-458(-)